MPTVQPPCWRVILDVADRVPGQLHVSGDLRHAHGLPAQRQGDGRAALKITLSVNVEFTRTCAKVLESNNYPATFDRTIKI